MPKKKQSLKKKSPVVITRQFKRAIGLVGDLHAGSESAPWPKDFKTKAGVPRPPSEKQQYLNSCLTEFGKQMDDCGCDSLWLLGDLTDGNNRKAWGAARMTANLNEQVDAAVSLLSPLAKGREVLGVAGSGYHDSLDKFLDQDIVEKLGGTFLGLLAHVRIKNTNRIAQITHSESVAVVYREQVMANEGAALFQAEGRLKLPFHVDIRIAGHLHWFAHLHTERQHIIHVPCWTDWYPWRKGLKSYGRMIPDIGACILMIDDKDRFFVLPFTYKRPMIHDDVID